MATSWLFRAILAGCLGVGAAGAAACTLLTGVGDLSVETGADATADAVITTPPPPPETGDGAPDVQDSGALDADLFGDVDATLVDACSPTGCLPVPDGFVLVAYGPRNGACPSGFTNGVDVIENETVEPAACSCGCNVTNPGRCPSSATIDFFLGNVDAGATTCAQEIGPLTGGPNCQTDGYEGPFHPENLRRWVPAPQQPVELACASPANKNPFRVSGTPVRLCQADVVPACNALVCPSDPGGGFNACIATSRQTSCPPEWPKAHAIGTGVTFDCDTTGCGCSITGECTGGALAFFTGSTCTGAPGLVVEANGTCAPTPGADGGTFQSHLYVPSAPQNVACTPSGTANVVNTAVAQPATVCCTK